MNQQQMTEFQTLETVQQRSDFLLTIGVTAKIEIKNLRFVYQAKVGTTLLPITAPTEEEAIALGTEWLQETASR